MTKRRHAHEDDFTTYPKDRGVDGLALFEQRPVEPPAPPEEASIDEAFRAFHRDHAHVYAEIERRALALHRVGAVRVGVGAIVEAMRYDHALRTKGGDWKINNNFRSRYARLLVEDHPELRDVVELRELRSA